MINRVIIKLKTAVYKTIQRIVGTSMTPVLAPFSNKILNRLAEIRGGQRLVREVNVKMSHHMFRRPYKEGEKVRIVFLFQAASFWPSWETVWKACVEDAQIEPIMLVCDDPIKEKVQFATAREFLASKNIAFRHVSEVNLDEVRPHIVILHTPYDSHRPKYLQAPRLTANGYRIVYIPYGIEISDSPKARSDHFHNNVTTSAWRVYTFSDEMIPDYKLRSPTGGDMVRSFGHPRFDGLVALKSSKMPDHILEKSKGRKIVLWKVHFPKKVKGVLITPKMDEYFAFARKIADYDDLFFVFMPHPKFYEQLKNFANVNEFKAITEVLENFVEYNEDEYQQVLLNCDYYIVDRSALMLEAGFTGQPVLYMENSSYSEPMTRPVQRVIDAYYQGSTFDDMDRFIQDVVLGTDTQLEQRVDAFNQTFKGLDGKIGSRIKDDMVNTLKNE